MQGLFIFRVTQGLPIFANMIGFGYASERRYEGVLNNPGFQIRQIFAYISVTQGFV